MTKGVGSRLVQIKTKKTRQGNGKYTKHGAAGPKGQSKNYRKRYRGQGK
jgi:hypothetical protein